MLCSLFWPEIEDYCYSSRPIKRSKTKNQGCDRQNRFDDPDIDGSALDENYISITPIQCDMTDYAMLAELKTWGIDNNGT